MDVRSCQGRINLKKRTQMKLATWNVRTLNRIGAAEELEKEVERYGVDIVALQEMRWKGTGKKQMKNGTMYWSGGRKREEGTGFYIKKRLDSSILEFEPVSSRICRLRLQSKWFNTTLICVHAPTEETEDTTKDRWYSNLQRVVDRTP